MEFKRIPCGAVTDALIKAMDNADKFDTVIILAQGKPGPNEGAYSYENSDVTVACALFLAKCYEWWLMEHAK
jgi:hypothetical protein